MPIVVLVHVVYIIHWWSWR